MKIDLTCPVEVWQIIGPSQEEPECTFALNNLSEKTVVSVQVALACHNREEELLFRQIERIQGLHGEAGSRFSFRFLPTRWEEDTKAELVVEKVWFDDSVVWRRESGAMTEYEPNALPAGRRLDQLRFVAGQDAVGYPAAQVDVWVCVCGRANARKSDRCCRCGRRRETVFASYQQENVEQIIAVHEQKLLDIAKKAREDAGNLAAEREKLHERKKKRTRRAWKSVIALVCLAALATAGVVWGIPEYRYHTASQALEAADFAAARAGFVALEDYRDAGEQVKRCDYLEAKAWLAAGDGESLQKAADAFLLLDDYEDCQELERQAVYQMGSAAMAAEAYEQALEHFAALGDYQDSTEKTTEIHYLQALGLFDSKAYGEAEAGFVRLGGYRDAAEKAVECKYQAGLAAEESRDYLVAIERFEATGDYGDAAQRLQSVRYLLAEQKLTENALEEAGNLFLQAGDFLDARMKANDSLYQLAQEQFRAEEYEKSKVLFEQIVPYLDSEGMAWECVYRLAEKAREGADYAAAIALFAEIPAHQSAAEKLKECQYLLAAENIAAKKLPEAEALLSELAGYQDSDKLLKQARYQLGEAFAAEGDYQKAVDMYELLGSYLSSPARLRDSRYQLARNALIDRKYEEAAAGFSALGNYEDAGSLLQQAYYEHAMERKAAGDTEKAMELLLLAAGNEEARREYIALILAQAQAQKDAGELEAAKELLLEYKEEPEALALYQSWQYDLAAEKKQAGLYGEAGDIFQSLGNYRDAAQQQDESYSLYYGVVAEPARAAFQNEEYRTVIETLDGFSMEGLPRDYRDLQDIYRRACYAYAEALYAENKPYEALPYYLRVQGYRDVQQKLERRAYLLLGKWKNPAGGEAEFRTDGTCTIMGEVFCFAVENYALNTGPDAASLTTTHRLTNLTRSGLTLRDVRNGRNVVYKFDKEAPADFQSLMQPGPTLSPTVTPGPTPAGTPLDDMLVQEEPNETDE